jgi:hypothetical protein
MPLYQVERHERLLDAEWNEDRARAAIDRIVSDANRTFTADGLWPIHPLDRSPERPPDSLKILYYGAAGVIWALNYLDETGAVKLGRDYLPTVRELVQRNRADIQKYEDLRKYMGTERSSYLLGEAGLLLLHWKLAPSDDLARQLGEAIKAKIGDLRGLAWGASGTMLAALLMHERTADPRSKELFLRNFEALWNKWEYDDKLHCHLWTHDLYGVTEKRLGAIHGFAATAFPMIRGRNLLPSDRLNELLSRIHQTLNATVLGEENYTNWPNNVGPTTRSTPLPPFLQHCNGAPGIINCMANFPDDSRWPLDAMLQNAGELVWAAGPPVKFPSLCHGAAGSGYALLKLYTRTGDDRWLYRARRFAMHAIDQCDRAVTKYGQRNYSLWTGDLGLAVYLWDCVRGAAKFPTLDVF